jgi:hypothetical protein
MVNLNKIKKWNEEIKKNNGRLKEESDFKKKEKLRLQNAVLELKIKIERLN